MLPLKSTRGSVQTTTFLFLFFSKPGNTLRQRLGHPKDCIPKHQQCSGCSGVQRGASRSVWPNHETLHKCMAQRRGAADRVRTQLCSSVDRMRNGFKYKHDWESVVVSKWWNGLFRELRTSRLLPCKLPGSLDVDVVRLSPFWTDWMFKLSQQANLLGHSWIPGES